MSLKTSFFNPTLLKSNIKRFWWVSAGYVVLFLTLVILPLISYNGSNYTGLILVNVISALACALLPAILFSYLNSAGAVTCMHAFPIKRTAHFITNTATIYLLFLVPMIIGYAITTVIVGMNLMSDIYSVFELFGSGIILMTIAISGATLGVMVTGNTVAAIVFGALFISFPFYTEAIFRYFLILNVHGIWEMDTLLMFENFRVHELNTFMWIYFAVSLVILAVAWLLYKNRKLETNGDIISYKFLKPVFIGCVSVFVGFLGYFYLYELYNYSNIFFMLPFGLIGVVISYMLSKKAFTFKGMWRPFGIYALTVCALFATVKFDLTGFERRIPDIDDIASVNISERTLYTYSNDTIRYVNGREYYYEKPISVDDYAFTEKEDIQNVINLHQHLIESKGDNEYRIGRLPIVYTLKNGKTVKRFYDTAYATDKEFLAPVYQTKQMKKQNWQILAVDDEDITSVTVQNARLRGNTNESRNETFAIYPINDERAKALVEAILTDIENVSFEHIYNYPRGTTSITIEYIRHLVDKDGKPIDEKLFPEQENGSTTFTISPEYINTVKLLEEYGLYEKEVKADEIAYATLTFNGETDSSVKIEEQPDIKALYDYATYYESTNYGGGMSLGDYVHYVEIKFYDADANRIFEEHITQNPTVPFPAILLYESQKFDKKYYEKHFGDTKAAVFADEPYVIVELADVTVTSD